MRLSLFSMGILLTLALIVTGCGDGNNSTKPSPPDNTPSGGNNSESGGNGTASSQRGGAITTGQTSHPSEEAVRQFLMAMLDGNTERAFALFTPNAQAEYKKVGFALEPELFRDMAFRITGSAPSNSDDNAFGVYVDMLENGEVSFQSVWGVRKIINEFRIAGLVMSIDGEMQELDFENLAGTLSVINGQPPMPPNQAPPNQVPPNQIPMNNNAQMMPQAPQQFPQPPQQFAPPSPPPFNTAQPNMPNIQ